MKTEVEENKATSLLAAATGIGSIGAAMFGIVGAVGGAVLGFGVGYWNQVETKKATHNYHRNQGKKAHV